jgi:zinc resistance-associated protein
MKTFRFVCLALALALALGASAFALAAESGNVPEQPQKAVGMNKYAHLTPEKQAIAKKLHTDFRQDTKNPRKELAAKEDDLRALMAAPTLDESKIRTLAKEIADLRAVIYLAKIDMRVKLAKEGISFGDGERRGRGDGFGKGKGKHRGDN